MPVLTTPKEELHQIAAEVERLEARRAAIYRASVDAPVEEKVCDDWMATFLGGDESEVSRFIQYPIEVHGITFQGEPIESGPKVGRWVAVRPCAKPDDLAPDGKPIDGCTFLGVYIGDVALGSRASFHPQEGILAPGPAHNNPAMWVPDLKRVIFGCGSWWRLLAKPEDLAAIKDVDIENVWYVRALRDLQSAPAPEELS